MLLNAPSVDRLIEAFRRLPGIGRRTAERLALHLLSGPADEAEFFIESIRDARAKVRRCSACRNLTEVDPCTICGDARRDHALLCVVEQPSGAMAIERGGSYRGVYHVLHGVLNPLDGIGPSELNIAGLVERVKTQGVTEVVVATNATSEGEATAMYLSKQLTPLGVQVTRIAHGVPMGGGLEFADDVTLSHAMDGRTRM